MKYKNWSRKVNSFFRRKSSTNTMSVLPKEETTAVVDQIHPQTNKEEEIAITPNNSNVQSEQTKNLPIDYETCLNRKNSDCNDSPSTSFFQKTSNEISTTTELEENQITQKTSETDQQTPADSNISQPSESNTKVTSSKNSLDSSKQLKIFPKRNAMDFVFGKFIGEGSYSRVYLCRDIHSKRTYAIKVCNKQQIVDENKKEYVQRERQALSILSNVSGFLNLFCTFQDPKSLYFVMTYAKNGDLLHFINKAGSFNLKCAKFYAAELVLACENMHSRNVIHRDLKPENILLDNNMHTLIADFGSAKILTSTESQENQSTATPNKDECNDKDYNENDLRRRQRRRTSFVGTAQYVSPEVLINDPVTPAADLWALGCIIYQMISGSLLFQDEHEFLVFKKIRKCNIEFPQGFDPNAENLIRSLIKLNPMERIGAKDTGGSYDSIRSHPFLEGIDFSIIRNTKPPSLLPLSNGDSNYEKTCNDHFVPENLKPGLDKNQVRRLLAMEYGTFDGA